jgi:hypothetical protein
VSFFDLNIIATIKLLLRRTLVRSSQF